MSQDNEFRMSGQIIPVGCGLSLGGSERINHAERTVIKNVPQYESFSALSCAKIDTPSREVVSRQFHTLKTVSSTLTSASRSVGQPGQPA